MPSVSAAVVEGEPAAGPPGRGDRRAGVAQRGGHLVGLVLGDRAVVDQPGQGVADAVLRRRGAGAGIVVVGQCGQGDAETGQGQRPGGAGDDQLLAHDVLLSAGPSSRRGQGSAGFLRGCPPVTGPGGPVDVRLAPGSAALMRAAAPAWTRRPVPAEGRTDPRDLAYPASTSERVQRAPRRHPGTPGARHRGGMRRPSPRRLSLRARLLWAFLVPLAVVLAVAGVAATTALRSELRRGGRHPARRRRRPVHARRRGALGRRPRRRRGPDFLARPRPGRRHARRQHHRTASSTRPRSSGPTATGGR